jgi:competence protein ComEC
MPHLKISFLNAGHGDFIYTETPLGDNLVIDLGTGDVIPAVFLRNIPIISELQISHPHIDHFEDIINVSKKIIKSFRCPNLSGFEDRTNGWKKSDLDKIAKLKEIKSKIPTDNDAVKVGNGFHHTVWAPSIIDFNDPNTASLVTILAYQGVKVLLGGDLPSNGWEDLLKKPSFVSAISGTAIFKVPHHGREEGCCKALFELDSFNPKLCIVSDKPLDKTNENTASTDWYARRSLGCNVEGYFEPRKVLTTRSDNSIFVKVNEKGTWWVYPNTNWKNE